jgi:hypothetical protein
MSESPDPIILAPGKPDSLSKAIKFAHSELDRVQEYFAEQAKSRSVEEILSFRQMIGDLEREVISLGTRIQTFGLTVDQAIQFTQHIASYLRKEQSSQSSS